MKGNTKEIFLMKELVKVAKEYLPISKIEEMEIELPKGVVNKRRLAKLFAAIGIKLKAREGKRVKLISIRERA